MKNRFIKSTAVFAAAAVLLVLMGAAPKASAADSASKAGVVSTAAGALNVRSSASLSAGVITKLPRGSYVTLLSQSGSFWKVEYGPGQIRIRRGQLHKNSFRFRRRVCPRFLRKPQCPLGSRNVLSHFDKPGKR